MTRWKHPIVTSRRTILLLLLCLITFPAVGQTNILDPSFAPVPSVEFTPDSAAATGILLGPDGKTLIWGGDFAVGGKTRSRIARLATNGALDESFTYCSCGLDSVANVAVQPDGKYLVGGLYFGQAKIIRLHPDGSLDTTFASYSVAIRLSLHRQRCCAFCPTAAFLPMLFSFSPADFTGDM